MCGDPLIQRIPADKLLSGVIALDFEGPVFYGYLQLGRMGLKNLQKTGAVICKFRGYRAKLILKIRRLRKAHYFPVPSRLSMAA